MTLPLVVEMTVDTGNSYELSAETNQNEIILENGLGINVTTYGAPIPVDTVAKMIDATKLYLYVGNETGYTFGDWYYYDGTAWVSGGAYGLASGQGLTLSQWEKIIQLFRGAVYDMSVISDPKSIIDYLDDSFTRIPATNITLSSYTVTATSTDVVPITATLTPPSSTDSIYAISSDTDVATVAVNNKVINITPISDGTANITVTTDSGLTATIAVTCDLPAIYSITNNLTGCTTSNDATQISEGSNYTATLTVDDRSYVFASATITVGGVDVTSSVWDASTGVISISNVTGAIVITVTAEERVVEYGIVFPASFVPIYGGFFKSSTVRSYQFDTLVFDINISQQTGSKVIIKGLTSTGWLGISNGTDWNNPWGTGATPAFSAMTWGVRTNVSFNINIAQSASPSSGGTLGWGSGNSMNPAMTLYGIKCLSNGVVVADFKAKSDFSYVDTVSGVAITPNVTTGLTVVEVE